MIEGEKTYALLPEFDAELLAHCSFLPFLIPALIGAATSIGGALIQGSQQERQAERQYSNDMAAAQMQRAWQIEDRDEARNYSRSVYSNLVKDAEAAGFNPLTALRNGGGANYNAAAGFAPLSRTAPVRQATMGPDIGGALRDVGSFIANFDPFADDKREAEYQLVQAQIANLNASTGALKSQSFKVPTYTATPRERRPSGRQAQLGPGAGENGEILPMWTTWTDRDGNRVDLPNPKLPESEQFFVPILGPPENSIYESGKRFRKARESAPQTREWTVGDVVNGVSGAWENWRKRNDRQWRAYQANKRN